MKNSIYILLALLPFLFFGQQVAAQNIPVESGYIMTVNNTDEPNTGSSTAISSNNPIAVGYKSIFGSVSNRISKEPISKAEIRVYHRIVDVLDDGTNSLRPLSEY